MTPLYSNVEKYSVLAYKKKLSYLETVMVPIVEMNVKEKINMFYSYLCM